MKRAGLLFLVLVLNDARPLPGRGGFGSRLGGDNNNNNVFVSGDGGGVSTDSAGAGDERVRTFSRFASAWSHRGQLRQSFGLFNELGKTRSNISSQGCVMHDCTENRARIKIIVCSLLVRDAPRASLFAF